MAEPLGADGARQPDTRARVTRRLRRVRLPRRARLRQDARGRRVAGASGLPRPGRLRQRGDRAHLSGRQVHVLRGRERADQRHPAGADQGLQQERSRDRDAQLHRRRVIDPWLHGRKAGATARPAAHAPLVRRAGRVDVRRRLGHGHDGPAPRQEPAGAVDDDAQAQGAGAPAGRAQDRPRDRHRRDVRQPRQPARQLLRPARPVRGHDARPAGAVRRADRPGRERHRQAQPLPPVAARQAAAALRPRDHVARHGLHRKDDGQAQRRPGSDGMHRVGRVPPREAQQRDAARLLGRAPRPARPDPQGAQGAERQLRRRRRHGRDQADVRQQQAAHVRPQAGHPADRGQGLRHQPAPDARARGHRGLRLQPGAR